MDDDTPILAPKPRRPFDISTDTANNSNNTSHSLSIRNTDFAQQLEARLQRSRNNEPAPSSATEPETQSPSRTRSFMNLTSSTLFGIYSPTTGYEASEPATPWGTGAETPARRESVAQTPATAGKESFIDSTPREVRTNAQQESLPRLALRVATLFAFGLAYGRSIQQLHEHGQSTLAPVNVGGVDREDWRYYVGWGLSSISLGLLLPLMDATWPAAERREARYDSPVDTGDPSAQDEISRDDRQGDGQGWNHVVRSVGVFVAIAFAIRKLPWRSTLQLSFTLALINPMLWYIVDRTLTGFTLASLVGILGTIAMLGINPGIIPTPAAHEASYFQQQQTGGVGLWNQTSRTGGKFGGVIGGEGEVLEVWGWGVRYEDVGLATWLASVCFCSAVCFGNIGRRLKGRRR